MNQAIFDLDEIRSYIGYNSLFYAKITVYKLKDRTTILKKNPRSGTVVPEYERENIRELIEGNYRIIYHIFNEFDIWILAIVHGARDLTKIKLNIP